MLGFTGTYKGNKVSVQGSGMGIPSISIYTHELINEYDVKTLIRVGTCGAMQERISIKDIIIAMGGDGTVLHGLGLYPTTPILAINYGTVGFLTAGDKEALDTILERLLAGKYIISERCRLQCSFKNKTRQFNTNGAKNALPVNCNVNDYIGHKPVVTRLEM